MPFVNVNFVVGIKLTAKDKSLIINTLTNAVAVNGIRTCFVRRPAILPGIVLTTVGKLCHYGIFGVNAVMSYVSGSFRHMQPHNMRYVQRAAPR